MKMKSFAYFLMFSLVLFSQDVFGQEGGFPAEPQQIDSFKMEGMTINIWVANSMSVPSDAILNPFQPNGYEPFFRADEMTDALRAMIREKGLDASPFINISEINLVEVDAVQRLGFFADLVYQGLKAAQNRGVELVAIPALGMSLTGTMSEADAAIAVLAGIERFLNEVSYGRNSLKTIQITFCNSIAGFPFDSQRSVYEALDLNVFRDVLKSMPSSLVLSPAADSIGEILPDWRIAQVRSSLIVDIEGHLKNLDANGRGFLREDLSDLQRQKVNRDIAKDLANLVLSGKIKTEDVIVPTSNRSTVELNADAWYVWNRVLSMYQPILKGNPILPDFRSLNPNIEHLLLNLYSFARERFQVALDTYWKLPVSADGLFFETINFWNGQNREVVTRLAPDFVRGERSHKTGDAYDSVRAPRAQAWRAMVNIIMKTAKF